MTVQPRVLVADDHRAMLDTLVRMLSRDFDVVAAVMDGVAVVTKAEQLEPDLLVMDIAMPGLNGIDAARAILRASPDTRTILLTVHEEHEYIVEALRAGVSGYLLKTKAASDLVRAIKEVSQGALYISPGMSRDLLKSFVDNKEVKADPLSPREREVLQLIAEGKSMKEVGSILQISTATVAFHKYRIMEQLHIKTSAELIRFAVHQHLVS